MEKGYEWYQCDIINKIGVRSYWCRFISDSQENAEKYIENLILRISQSNLKNKILMKLTSHLIKEKPVYKVSRTILNQYNLNDSKDVDLFHRQYRG